MDVLILLLVVGCRFFIPLFILRYPLPAIVASLILDAVDQTIFQTFTTLPLDGYQSYDKALDIYYLTIAYISTFRNWESLAAFGVSRFLFYYRMVGVVLFEIFDWRGLLLIFPNTFEYFYIYIETLRTKWDIRRLSMKHFVVAAGFIWIFIKLPQEYWIHIAQRDVTDTIKYNILGAEIGASWSQALQGNGPIIVAFLALVFILVGGAIWLWRRAPKEDWPFHVAQPNLDKFGEKGVQQSFKLLSAANWEKLAMLSLLCFCFSQIMPRLDVSLWQVGVGVALVVAVNTFVSMWASSHTIWRSSVREFVVLTVMNGALISIYSALLSSKDGFSYVMVLFFALMLTLLIVLYDRYRVIYDARFGGLS